MTVAIQKKRVTGQKKSSDFVRGLVLFTNLTDKEIAQFTDVSQTRTYKKGKTLYSQGQKAGSFYVILSGWVKLFHMTEEGEEVILAMLTKDGIIGKNAIFEDGNFTSSAQIIEDAELMSIPLKLLKEQIRSNNQVALNMLHSMMKYQRLHERQLEQYLLYSAPQRIGCFLLGLCPVLDQKDGVVLNLPYDKTLIASTLGMRGATFSRALNILRHDTGLTITGSRVKIDSIERLLKFVNGCYSSYPPIVGE